MRNLKWVSIIGLGALMLVGGGSASASPWTWSSGSNPYSDPPGNFFPGKYFEYKAQFYLKKKNYRAALDMFELAGFWANKIAQYNAGLMYYNGLGVPVDKARGVAWLGIAAESHDDLAVRALQAAYASLNGAEKQQSEAVWQQLDAKYGDAVSLPRALQRYDTEAKTVTGSHLGFIGNVKVYEYGIGSGGDSLGESGFRYYSRQAGDRDKLIEQITGRVTVGAVTPIKVDDEVKKNASQVPLTGPQLP